jgi:hypothetical protein
MWRKPLVWFGGVGTAVLVGVLINVLTSQAQDLVPSTSGTSSSPSHIQAGNALKSPPLRVLSEDPLNIDNLGKWIFPSKRIFDGAELRMLNSDLLGQPGGRGMEGISNLLSPMGGYAPSVDTQIVVKNTRTYPVRIIDMSVIKTCRAPFTGTIVYAQPQGAQLSVQMGFNLDSADPTATSIHVEEDSIAGPEYFSEYTVKIKPGAQQVLDIYALTKKQACVFRYRATILDGSRKVYQTIGNGKQPFRVSAQLPLSRYSIVYVGGIPTSQGTVTPYERVDPNNPYAGS